MLHLLITLLYVLLIPRDVLQPEGPYKVTIVNRQYHKGRHMVNSVEIAQKIEEMPEVQSTR